MNSSAVPGVPARCSRSAPGRRFYGATHGVVSAPGPVESPQDAFIAWVRGSCVALASIGDAGGGRVDLSLLVDDSWYRRGTAVALLASAVRRARAREIACRYADVLAEAGDVVPLPARIGPAVATLSHGVQSVDVLLLPTRAPRPVVEARRRPEANLPTRTSGVAAGQRAKS